MHGADPAMQRGLKFAPFPGFIKRGFQTKWRDLARRRAALGKGFLAAKKLEPAGFAQKGKSPRLGHELFMFAQAIFDQWQDRKRVFLARSARFPTNSGRAMARKNRQIGEPVMRLIAPLTA